MKQVFCKYDVLTNGDDGDIATFLDSVFVCKDISLQSKNDYLGPTKLLMNWLKIFCGVVLFFKEPSFFFLRHTIPVRYFQNNSKNGRQFPTKMENADDFIFTAISIAVWESLKVDTN